MHSRFSCADCKDYRFLQTRTECLLCARSCPRHQNAEVNRTQSSRSGLSPRQDATCINGEAVCMLQRRTWPRPENSRAGDIGVGGPQRTTKMSKTMNVHSRDQDLNVQRHRREKSRHVGCAGSRARGLGRR